MMIVGIVGGFIALGLLLLLMEMFNRESFKRFGYEFFTWEKFSLIGAANLMLYFGNSWYGSAQLKGGDTLNGTLLVAMGVLIYMVWLYRNVDHTNYAWGVTGSILSAIIFLPGSFVAFFAVLIAAAWLSDTKPVVVLNPN